MKFKTIITILLIISFECLANSTMSFQKTTCADTKKTSKISKKEKKSNHKKPARIPTKYRSPFLVAKQQSQHKSFLKKGTK